MGYKNRAEQETISNDNNNNSSSLSEALLFATMCIIGLPVDVYVKDGSVYSGIFYTASVEKDYGIVLKKAKMTKKGKSNTNVANGAVIETLVIISADLVQVVAKGVQLPPDCIAANFAGDDVEAVAGTVPFTEGQLSEAKRSVRSGVNKRRNQKRISMRNENGYCYGDVPTKAENEQDAKKRTLNNLINGMGVEHAKEDGIDRAKIEEMSVEKVNGRQARDERSLGEQDSCALMSSPHREENADGVQGSSSNLCNYQAQVTLSVEGHPDVAFKQPNGVSHDHAHDLNKPGDQCSGRPNFADTSSLNAPHSSVLTSSNPVSDVTSGSCCSSSAASTEIVTPQGLQSSRSFKESKLNPGAKIFSPSFATHISTTQSPIPAVANMGYMPSNSPVLPNGGVQSEVGINPYVPHASVPAKFVPYGNLTAGNGGSNAQFSQPIVGHIGSRSQPVRYASQYHPVQAGPAYVHPNSHVMVGRLGGQLLYVQPVSNDLVQGVAAISPVSARPALTTPQVQFPKHQGNAAGQALQLCSPLVAGGLQPFTVPSHIPILQPPIPANRPFPIPGSNGLYNTKFP